MTINLTDVDLDKNPTLKRQMLFELEHDERNHKKQFNSLVRSYQDYEDWCNSHKIEHNFQQIVLNLLSNVQGVKVYDMKLRLKQKYLLDNESVNRIMDHLINENKFVEVDKKGQSNPLLFELYKKPRQKPAEHPHSLWLPQHR